MKDNIVTMADQKTIAIVAHDNKKQDLLAWAKFNREALAGHNIIATGTTGTLLHAELGLTVTRLQSGPLGGDQQIGAKISDRPLPSSTARLGRPSELPLADFTTARTPPAIGALHPLPKSAE